MNARLFEVLVLSSTFSICKLASAYGCSSSRSDGKPVAGGRAAHRRSRFRLRSFIAKREEQGRLCSHAFGVPICLAVLNRWFSLRSTIGYRVKCLRPIGSNLRHRHAMANFRGRTFGIIRFGPARLISSSIDVKRCNTRRFKTLAQA